MCWVSQYKPIRRIAESDIKVYKILHEVNGRIVSPVYSIVWTTGVTNEIGHDIFPEYVDNEWNIRRGFHSLKKCPVVVSGRHWMTEEDHYLFGYDKGDVVYECVIPAGSIYYENELGEFVSDALIVLNKC